MEPQCSDLFAKVFDSGIGGCVRTCECGITHFDGYNIYDWEDGELEELREKSRKEPDKYIEHDCSIGTISIGGREIVWGCSCDIARRYEKFLRSEAPRIAEYLNKLAVKLKGKANSIIVKQP